MERKTGSSKTLEGGRKVRVNEKGGDRRGMERETGSSRVVGRKKRT